MGKFSGILLASDYDGTLAAGDGTIPERVRQAIRAFIAEGGRFTVSTGRTLLGFHAYDPELINAPAILANGGIYESTVYEPNGKEYLKRFWIEL